MRIVLLGDIHVYQLRVRPWDLLGKRLLGQANLWLHRRFRFKLEHLPAVIERAALLKPDLVLCSGDLTTTALPGEFEMAEHALQPLLRGTPAIIVPGNHDRYTFTAARTKRFEQSLGPHAAPAPPPTIRRLGPRLALIALDPTRPNLITARGELGQRLLDELDAAIKQLHSDDRLIVLCHYTIGVPPGHKPEPAHHTMKGVAELIDLLRGSRATLYLHGHVHDPWCVPHPAASNILTLNAGAPVMVTPDWPAGQGFWEIETDPASGAADWKFTHHAMDSDRKWSAEVIAAGQRLTVPRSVAGP